MIIVGEADCAFLLDQTILSRILIIRCTWLAYSKRCAYELNFRTCKGLKNKPFSKRNRSGFSMVIRIKAIKFSFLADNAGFYIFISINIQAE